MLPLTNPNLNALNTSINLSFSSDDGGSPVPRSSRPSLSRPLTSNPSPCLAKVKNNPTSPPQDNFYPSPAPPPLQNPLKQRPRFNSSQHPLLNLSPSNSKTKIRISAPLGIDNNNFANNNSESRDTTAAAVAVPDHPDPADSLYEYFPLGLDDWMPPIDAVYRPHLAHHTGAGTVGGGFLRSGLGVSGIKGKGKRCFGEDDRKVLVIEGG
jgi:hypothetical protein